MGGQEKAFTICFCAAFLTVTYSRKCFFEDMMWTPEGCVDCPFCEGGQGMDLQKEVLRNDDGDPIECRKCRPCGHGYYNDPDYSQYSCMKCPSCLDMNRKEYIPCSGSTKGQCGACINSDYEDKDRSLDSPCTNKKKDPPVSSSPAHTENTTLQSEIIADREVHHTLPKRSERSEGLSVEWMCLFITLAGLASIAVTVYFRQAIVRNVRKYCCKDPELGQAVSSRTTMISTDISSLGDSNLKCKINLSDDTDLETDALMLPGDAAPLNRNPLLHQELSLSSGIPSSGPECLHNVIVPAIEARSYPSFLLTMNDKYVTYTSKNIFDEDKTNPMFRELGVSDQKLYAEGTLFELQKQTYEDRMLHNLQTWIKKAGSSATFDVLCRALDEHGFSVVSNELLKMHEDKR